MNGKPYAEVGKRGAFFDLEDRKEKFDDGN